MPNDGGGELSEIGVKLSVRGEFDPERGKIVRSAPVEVTYDTPENRKTVKSQIAP